MTGLSGINGVSNQPTFKMADSGMQRPEMQPEGFVSSKMKLMQIAQQLQQLEEAGQANSPQYQKLQQEQQALEQKQNVNTKGGTFCCQA